MTEEEKKGVWNTLCQPTVFNFGRYEGNWISDGWNFELVIDEVDFKPIPDVPFAFDSQLQWRLMEAEDPQYEGALNKQGAELIRGFYFNPDLKEKAEEAGYSIKEESDWNRLMCIGYEVMEDATAPSFLGLSAYDLHLHPPGSMKSDMIVTKTLSHNNRWEDSMEIRRVASYRELRVLLDEWLNEPNITGVISSLLHHFEEPTKVSEGQRLSMNFKLPFCDTRLVSLVSDLSYFHKMGTVERRESEDEQSFFLRLYLASMRSEEDTTADS